MRQLLRWPSVLTVVLMATLTSAVTDTSSESYPRPCRGAEEFHCKAGGELHECLPSIWVCNDVKDCKDGSDEEATLCANYHENVACDLSDHFRCLSNSRCIPNIFKCDGGSDCPNEEDEANCTALSHGQSNCGPDSVPCADGTRCISRIFLCDNTADCSDGSDESHCNCTSGHPFHCADGLRCPPLTALCNGAVECKDASDEGGRCRDSSCSLQCIHGECYKTPSGPRCLCEGGFREIREGGPCEDIDECSEASPCDHHCSNSQGSYTCMCNNGYELEGRHLCRVAGDSSAILFFSDDYEVKAMNLATKEEWQVYAGKKMVIAVAYDPVTNRVYWADRAGKVYSKLLRGDDAPTLLIRSGIAIVYSMAMDWVGRNLYMADRENNRIVVCNVDRITCKSLLTRSITPTAIKLDIAERKLYWTDAKLPGVVWANMDGSAVATLAGDLALPNALGIDPPARTLYWMDAKTDTVEAYHLDQNSRKNIPALKVVHPFSMAVWEDKLYWSDWATHKLYSAHKKDGRNVTEVFPHFYGHSIAIYHEQMLSDSKPESNPCKLADCSQLCLLSPVKPGYTCACPLGMLLSQDGTTCIENDDSPLPTLIAGMEGNLYKLEMREFLDPRVIPLTRPDTNFKRISDLDYDPVTKDLFIADQRDGKIVKLNLLTKQRTILVRDATRPAGIAVDWSRKNLYWVDSMKNTLEVITTDGLYRTKLDIGEMCSGLDVEVSQSAGRVLLACESPNPRILSCTRQGAPCTVLASGRVRTPIGLAIDRRAVPDMVYWADADDYSVQRCSLDGRNRKVFSVSEPAALIFSGSKLFLSTVGHYNSLFATTNLSQDSKWAEIHLNTPEELSVWRHKGHIALTAIDWHLEQVYTERSFENFCIANTACQQLCLENELREKVCGCSTGMVVSDDHRSCVAKVCPPDTFRCPEDGSCIPNNVKCNGVSDCSNGADERPLVCHPCEVASFHCQSGECIDVVRVCDGHAHCDDKSDEANCSRRACDTGYSPCLSGDRCYLNVSLCDGHPDCADQTDEANCPPCQLEEFRCTDGLGKCLPNSWRCNGITDCRDDSDEHNCTAGCRDDEFLCAPDGAPAALCLPRARVCDKAMDCPAGDDELAELCLQVPHGCPLSDAYCTSQCGQAEFTCTSSRKCIPHRQVCDGASHCEDASDEQYCATIVPQDAIGTGVCDRGQFSCGSLGTCISGDSVCNGVMDCANSEDEDANCDVTCRHNGGCDHLCHAGPAGRRCSCQGGYRLAEDGFHCLDVNECLESDLCEQRCYNREGGFNCLCGPGYVLAPDAVTCRPAEGAHSRVALVSGRTLRWLGTGQTGARQPGALPLPLPEDTNVTAVQVDRVTKNTVVITADGSLGVLSAGSLRWTPILSGLQRPSFAVDGRGGNVYVSQQLRQTGATVQVCSLRTGVCRTVHEAADAEVPSLAVAAEARMLFFCERSTVSPTARIFRARLDGSFKNVILEKGLKGCSHIALDEPKERIYWVDPYLNKLNTAAWTGHSITQYKALDSPVSGLEVVGIQVQWLFPNGTLQRCRKHSSRSCSPVHYGEAGLAVSTDPGVVVEASSVCGLHTCPNLCVTSPDGPLCLCDDVTSQGCSRPKVLRSASPCSPDPCLPGGVCTPEDGGYYCMCQDGSKGLDCQVNKVGVLTETNFVTPLVVVLILLLIGASAAGLYYYYRRPLLLFKRKTSPKSEVRFSNPAFGAPKDEIDATLRNTAAAATASPLNTLRGDNLHGSMVVIDLGARLNGSGEDNDTEQSYSAHSSRGHDPLV